MITKQIYSEHPKYCQCCNSMLTFKQRTNKFCSKSCRATVTNTLRSYKGRLSNCKYCKADIKHSKKIYCNNICQANYKFENTTLCRFRDGLIETRNTLRRCLTHDQGYKCALCNISEYNNKPLTLQVDHIDGNAGNNFPTNLRLICPNCHSQTETFGGRNKGNGRSARGLSLG
jgi:hypothetical protein